MPRAFHLVVLAIEHDGNLTPDELCQGLGMALDDLDMSFDAVSVEGMEGRFHIAECLGVHEAQLDLVNQFRNKDPKDGTQ